MNQPKQEAPVPQQASGGIFTFFGIALLITAAEAFGLQWVWQHVIVSTFHVSNLQFGQMFVLLLTLKVLFRDFFSLGEMHDTVADAKDTLDESKKILHEMRDIQVFSEQNRAFQFQSQMAILAEVIKERDEQLRLKSVSPDK